MITEKEDLRIIRLNPSNYSVEYLYDDFEKLVNNTRIPSLCKQEVICWDKIEQKNGVSNKEDPEMKKINFTNVRKTMKRE
jgi:hypothetical protein